MMALLLSHHLKRLTAFTQPFRSVETTTFIERTKGIAEAHVGIIPSVLLPVLFSLKAVVGLNWKHSDGGTPYFVPLGREGTA